MSEGAFLANASVLIQANTKLFRDELAAALATVPKGIEIPIIAVAQTGSVASAAATLGKHAAASGEVAAASGAAAAGVGGTTAALKTEEVAAFRAGVALSDLAARTGQITNTNQLLAAASEQLAAAQSTVAGSMFRVESAQAAVAAAQTAVNRAAVSGTEAQKVLASSALESAVAFERQALSAAKAAAASAASEASGIAAANLALAGATDKLAFAQTEVVGAASAAAEANTVYKRSVVASAAAQEALDAALASGVGVQQVLARQVLAAAAAFEAEAVAAAEDAAALERNAAAAGHAATAQKNVARGAATSALAAAGLRGATLTANAGFIAGAAAAITFGKAIQTAASFETSLNVFAATTGATAEQLGQVSEAAQQLGKDITLPGVTAQSAADAMLELAKAGLSVQDSIDGARGVLQLAGAAAIDNAAATQIAASALNAFGLAGDQAVHVADVLANAANLSQGSIEDVGISLSQAAAVARQTGVGFEDTVAFLTELAQAGIRGSDAGTSLRVSLIRLINPTEKAQKILNKLNVEIRDQAGNVKPSVFNDFANAQRNLSKAQQDANAAVVFGTDGLRTYSIIARDGEVALGRVREELDKLGTAQEVNTAKTKGTAGAFENLKNQGSAFLLNLGDALKGPAKDAADILAGGIANINAGLDELNKKTKEIPPAFVDIVREAGKINQAVAARQFGGDVSGQTDVLKRFNEVNKQVAAAAGNASPALLEEQAALSAAVAAGKQVAGSGLLEEQKKLNQALLDSLGPGAAATSTIEGYRDAIHNAALEITILDKLPDKLTLPTPAAPPKPAEIGPTAKLDRRIAIASAEGNLSALLDAQQTALANINKRIANTGKFANAGNLRLRTKLFKEQTAAEVAVSQTQKQIADKAASDVKANADAAAKARSDADQAILDAFAPAEQRLDIRQAIAEKSGAPGALKAVAIARKKQLFVEIKQIQDNFNDTKNAASLIAAKRVEIVNLDAKITENIQAIFTQGQQDRADALQSQVNVAQAEGNIPLQIRLNNITIAAINKKIASDKLVGKALNDAKAERATLQTANQGLRDQNIQNQIALGQSVADLTGNKDQLIAALDAAIAADRARVAALKKAGKSSTVVQTELNGFLQQRKEALKKATDDAKEVQGRGTTAFDLLKEANDTFNRNAGNLINPSQPFAGPTGFTADIAQFLIRRQQPTANVSTAKADFTAPLVSVNSELITVIKENTDALRGKSDKSGPVSSGRTTQHPRVWAADSFWARRFQES